MRSHRSGKTSFLSESLLKSFPHGILPFELILNDIRQIVQTFDIPEHAVHLHDGILTESCLSKTLFQRIECFGNLHLDRTAFVAHAISDKNIISNLDDCGIRTELFGLQSEILSSI